MTKARPRACSIVPIPPTVYSTASPVSDRPAGPPCRADYSDIKFSFAAVRGLPSSAVNEPVCVQGRRTRQAVRTCRAVCFHRPSRSGASWRGTPRGSELSASPPRKTADSRKSGAPLAHEPASESRWLWFSIQCQLESADSEASALHARPALATVRWIACSSVSKSHDSS